MLPKRDVLLPNLYPHLRESLTAPNLATKAHGGRSGEGSMVRGDEPAELPFVPCVACVFWFFV